MQLPPIASQNLKGLLIGYLGTHGAQAYTTMLLLRGLTGILVPRQRNSSIASSVTTPDKMSLAASGPAHAVAPHLMTSRVEDIAMSAKTLTVDQLAALLAYVDTRKGDEPLRDRVVLLLSFKAGLRAAEITALRWIDVRDAAGFLAEEIHVPAGIKGGTGRSIPMHPALYAALALLWAHDNPIFTDPIIRGRDGARMSSNSLVQFLSRLYRDAGLQGCSSHSGRRTFITAAARRANQYACSIRDVQCISGHRHLSSVQPYLEFSPGTVDLVRSL